MTFFVVALAIIMLIALGSVLSAILSSSPRQRKWKPKLSLSVGYDRPDRGTGHRLAELRRLSGAPWPLPVAGQGAKLTDFVSIDVETANADLSSICQVGIACYKDGILTDEWKSYIDPEDEFDAINISIHGIDEATVRGAPKLPDVSGQLHKYLDNHVCVCHTHFDRVAIHLAFDKYKMVMPLPTWLDSAMVARRAWEQFSHCGYGLSNVCGYLGYSFSHHDALEDAKASAYILISAMEKTGLDIRVLVEASKTASRYCPF